MSEAFTPGPWQWWTSCSWRRLHGPPSGNNWVLMPTVASDNHPDIIVKDADMALISAAPEMFEALAAMIEIGGDDDGGCVIAKARAALAKARGET